MAISKAAELEIVSGLFFSAAEQMRRTLVRTAFSAVIYEVLDFGISIADSKGRMVSEAAGITSFIGANDYALKTLIEKLDLSTLRPGDVLMLNYPYWNSAHVSDALLMTPVFIEGGEGIDMFLCVRAHWVDLGAKDAGYVLDSTTIHQEGLIGPGLRIIKEGKLDEDLWQMLQYNSRRPETIAGDFGAQVACLRTGEAAVREIFARACWAWWAPLERQAILGPTIWSDCSRFCAKTAQTAVTARFCAMRGRPLTDVTF